MRVSFRDSNLLFAIVKAGTGVRTADGLVATVIMPSNEEQTE